MSNVGLALCVTLVVQILVSGASLSAAILVPLAGPELGVPAASVGYYVAALYAAAALAGVASGSFIQRWGALGTMQITLGCGAASQALLAVGTPGSIALAALMGGLSLGPTTPATSAILAMAAQRHRNLVFSLKQTGVPGGFMLAALTLPSLGVAYGWRGAAGMTALVLALAAGGLALARGRFDVGREAGVRVSVRQQLIDPLRRVLAVAEMRRLALASFAFSGLQGSLAGFLIVFLTHETALDLLGAAFVLAVAQGAGVGGRVLWGVVADRSGRPGLVLALLAFAMAGFGASVGLFAPYLPYGALVAVCFCFGGTAMAWNGVYLAEVARLASPDRVGEATGATGLFTFGGVAVLPSLFTTIVLTTDSYAAAYVFAAILPGLAGIALLINARR